MMSVAKTTQTQIETQMQKKELKQNCIHIRFIYSFLTVNYLDFIILKKKKNNLETNKWVSNIFKRKKNRNTSIFFEFTFRISLIWARKETQKT